MIVALCATFVILNSNASAQEVIHRFDSVVQVAKDGTLTVTETIRVRAEGREIKRGIYRDLPLTFRDAGGRPRRVTFKLLGVTRDGRPEPHFTRWQNRGIRIYAGKEDVLLRRGDYTYVIRYETGRQIRWFDEKPELNWNVTGNFWNFPINAASYRLHLPDSARPVRWTAFTGRVGERGTDWRGNVALNGALNVTTTRRLQPAEGLTVVAEIPQGAVARPDRFEYVLLDYRGWIIGSIGFALVLMFYAAAWNAVGRDPKAGIIIPLFHPPKGISPGLANYVHGWGFSRDKWRAFTAAALSLAVRGLVRFDDDSDTLRLKTTGREPDDGLKALPPGERAIFAWVKSQGGNAPIDKENGSAVASVGKKFTDAVEGENKHKFFRRNLGYFVVGLVLTALAIIATIVFGALTETDIMILFIMVFGGFWLGMFLVPLLMAVFGATNFASRVRAGLTVIALGVFFTLGANIVEAMTPEGLGVLVPTLIATVADSPFPFALVGSFAALNGLFLYLMRTPTALGRPVMDQLEGFKLYLETAESDRLNLQAPEITAERFEALLPYAVALDVEQPWSEAFAAALARAHPHEAEPMTHYRPAWRTGTWSSSNFSQSVSSTVSSASVAFASAVPASSGSSGFSGGGGSGGGGGGGGGGGW